MPDLKAADLKAADLKAAGAGGSRHEWAPVRTARRRRLMGLSGRTVRRRRPVQVFCGNAPQRAFA